MTLLQVAVFEPPHGPLELTISDGGGWHGSSCACSLLADSANCNAPTWDIDLRARDKLVETIAILAAHLPRPFSIEAIWDGDPVDREHEVTADALVTLVADDALGTRDRYVMSS
jgi:hypothetical protein